MKKIDRFICLVLSLFLFVSDGVLLHAAEANFWKERQNALSASQKIDSPLFAQLPLGVSAVTSSLDSVWTNTSRVTNPLLRSLSSSFGRVRKIDGAISNSEMPVIVHIQDIHMNEEAQLNIAKTIQELRADNKIDLIALEGASGEIDLSPFQDEKLQDSLQVSSEFLFKDKKISGPVYSLLMNLKSSIPSVVGIDDEEHYQSNIKAYRDAHRQISSAQEELTKIEKSIDLERGRLPQAFREFETKRIAYHLGELELKKYIDELSVSGNRYSSLVQFKNAIQIEQKLDFSRVEKERTEFLQRLSQRLRPLEMKSLMVASSAFHDGKISPTDFYSDLKALADSKGGLLSKTPMFALYVDYILISTKLDGENLLSEVAMAEREKIQKLAIDDVEKRLVRQDDEFLYLKKCITFSLTKSEWQKLNSHSPREFKSELFSPFLKFYSEAEFRDHAMAKNLLHSIKEKNAKKIILVTGGFHSEGIRSALMSPNEPRTTHYALISFIPTLTKVETQSGSAYLSLFAQKQTPLDQLYQGEKLFLSPRPMINPQVLGVIVIARYIRQKGGDFFVELKNIFPSIQRKSFLSFLNLSGRSIADFVKGSLSITFDGKNSPEKISFESGTQKHSTFDSLVAQRLGVAAMSFSFMIAVLILTMTKIHADPGSQLYSVSLIDQIFNFVHNNLAIWIFIGAFAIAGFHLVLISIFTLQISNGSRHEFKRNYSLIPPFRNAQSDRSDIFSYIHRDNGNLFVNKFLMSRIDIVSQFIIFIHEKSHQVLRRFNIDGTKPSELLAHFIPLVFLFVSYVTPFFVAFIGLQIKSSFLIYAAFLFLPIALISLFTWSRSSDLEIQELEKALLQGDFKSAIKMSTSQLWNLFSDNLVSQNDLPEFDPFEVISTTPFFKILLTKVHTKDRLEVLAIYHDLALLFSSPGFNLSRKEYRTVLCDTLYVYFQDLLPNPPSILSLKNTRFIPFGIGSFNALFGLHFTDNPDYQKFQTDIRGSGVGGRLFDALLKGVGYSMVSLYFIVKSLWTILTFPFSSDSSLHAKVIFSTALLKGIQSQTHINNEMVEVFSRYIKRNREKEYLFYSQPKILFDALGMLFLFEFEMGWPVQIEKIHRQSPFSSQDNIGFYGLFNRENFSLALRLSREMSERFWFFDSTSDIISPSQKQLRSALVSRGFLIQNGHVRFIVVPSGVSMQIFINAKQNNDLRRIFNSKKILTPVLNINPNLFHGNEASLLVERLRAGITGKTPISQSSSDIPFGLILPQNYANGMNWISRLKSGTFKKLISMAPNFSLAWYAAYVERYEIINPLNFFSFLSAHPNRNIFDWVIRSAGIFGVWTFPFLIFNWVFIQHLGIHGYGALSVLSFISLYIPLTIFSHGLYGTFMVGLMNLSQKNIFPLLAKERTQGLFMFDAVFSHDPELAKGRQPAEAFAYMSVLKEKLLYGLVKRADDFQLFLPQDSFGTFADYLSQNLVRSSGAMFHGWEAAHYFQNETHIYNHLQDHYEGQELANEILDSVQNVLMRVDYQIPRHRDTLSKILTDKNPLSRILYFEMALLFLKAKVGGESEEMDLHLEDALIEDAFLLSAKSGFVKLLKPLAGILDGVVGDVGQESLKVKTQYLTALFYLARSGTGIESVLKDTLETLRSEGIQYASTDDEKLKIQILILTYVIASKGRMAQQGLAHSLREFHDRGITYHGDGHADTQWKIDFLKALDDSAMKKKRSGGASPLTIFTLGFLLSFFTTPNIQANVAQPSLPVTNLHLGEIFISAGEKTESSEFITRETIESQRNWIFVLRHDDLETLSKILKVSSPERQIEIWTESDWSLPLANKNISIHKIERLFQKESGEINPFVFERTYEAFEKNMKNELFVFPDEMQFQKTAITASALFHFNRGEYVRVSELVQIFTNGMPIQLHSLTMLIGGILMSKKNA